MREHQSEFSKIISGRSKKQYRQENSQQTQEKQSEFYEWNRPQLIQYQKNYRNNREMLKLKKKYYYEGNKEQTKETKALYHHNNKDKLKESHRTCYAGHTHKENISERERQRDHHNKDKFQERMRQHGENNKDNIAGRRRELSNKNKHNNRDAEILEEQVSANYAKMMPIHRHHHHHHHHHHLSVAEAKCPPALLPCHLMCQCAIERYHI